MKKKGGVVLVWLIVRPYSNSVKYSRIIMKSIYVIEKYYGMLGIENKMCIFYISFTKTFKRISLHYDYEE